MVAAGDTAQGSKGLPLAAGHQQQGFAVGQVANLLDRHEQFIRAAHVAKLARLGDHVEHGAAQQTDLAAMLHRQLEDHRDPVGRAGKGGENHPAFGITNVAIEVGEHGPLRRRETGQLGVGGITEKAQHPLLAVVGHALDVEILAIDRGVVEFEVAGEDHHASGGGNRQGEAVGEGVGVADELHLEVLPNLHHVAWRDGLEDRAIHHARFLHLAREHGEGQTGPIDHRNREVLEVVGNATDVIFMAVGHDHAANPLLVFAQIAGIGQHHVDAMHAIAGEGEAAIHQHQVIAVFKNAGVFADLMQTTEGNHPQGGLLVVGFGAGGAGVTGDRIGWAHQGKGRERDAGGPDRTGNWADAMPPNRSAGRAAGRWGWRAGIGLGVRWDAGLPGLWLIVRAHHWRRRQGEDGGRPRASRSTPARL